MPDLTLVAEKARIRAAVLALRRSAPPQARAAADAALRSVLALVVPEKRALTVAAYSPFRTEPGGPELPAAIGAAGARVLLPVRLPDKDLSWAWSDDPGAHLGVAAIRQADLVVAPAVAVDERGVRLGRGGGSYDRALARVDAGVLVVALLYDGELVPVLPAEPHDRRVGAVITPTGGFVDLPTSAGRARGG